MPRPAPQRQLGRRRRRRQQQQCLLRIAQLSSQLCGPTQQMPAGRQATTHGRQVCQGRQAPPACTTCSAVCGSWEPPASLTAALQAADAEQPADFGSLGLSQLLGTAGTGLAGPAAAAGAADCAGEEEKEGEEEAGSERPS
jgi:hypothetical protein